MIIGISGLAGSGKNTAADIIAASHNVRCMAFADPLKEVLLQLFRDFGVRPEDLYGVSSDRAKVVEGLERPDRDPGGVTLRYLLQTLGTEWGREFVDRDLWVKIALRRAQRAKESGYSAVVFTDVRFENERDAVLAAGGEVWYIDRPSAGIFGNHLSERDMKKKSFRTGCTHVVPNKGTLNELKTRVEHLAACAIKEEQ